MTLTPAYLRDLLFFLILMLFALGIYHKIFSADYLYLDDAYALWHRDRDYTPFASQGRLISGIIFQKLFTVVDTIREMKFLRIASLTGWVLSAIILYSFAKKWVKELQLSSYLPFLLSVFCICNNSVAIYIGWASCFEVFLSFLSAICSGHILFSMLAKQKEHFDLSFISLFIVIVLGVVSLLIYQNPFGVFILPFLLMWIGKDIPAQRKKVIVAIIIYLLIYLIYFLIFKYYLKKLNITTDIRTAVAINPFKKIGFFFSTPFSQAWSLNLLHNLHSYFSQMLPLILFAGWIFLFIKKSTTKKPGSIIIKIITIIIITILSYLPSLAAKENFSSYRTMIALSLCVFSVFMAAILDAVKNEKGKMIFVSAFAVFLLIIAYINLNVQFLLPLKKEFNAISSLPVLKTVTKNDTIVFIRADAKLFSKLYGIKSYKDEFGIPSTYRDWAPDGLTRQLIEEKQSKDIAEKITIYQFENMRAYIDSMKNKLTKPILIDINTIMKE